MGGYAYDSVIKYKISAKTMSPLHIGGHLGIGDEVLTDAVTGVPFIQASSLAGMFRGTSAIVFSKAETDELFGPSKQNNGSDSSERGSRVRITDGVIDPETVVMEIRPGVSVDRKTGTVNSRNGAGQKFDVTYVSSNAVFSFDVYLYINNEKRELKSRLESLFGMMNNGKARLGAKKSGGAGKFEAVSIRRAEFDLQNDEDRKKWILEDDGSIQYTDITKECRMENTDIKYDITVEAKTEGPIQIKGVSMSEFGKDVPNSENIKNGAGEFIIPGTSIKGAVRSQMEKIAAYQNKKSVINDTFGFIAEEHSDSKCGNITFNDVVIGRREENDANPLRNRIHIDKFTGGVMSPALFKEKNAAGDLKIEIQIHNRSNPDATLGLLIIALRDLAVKSFNLGNGYATGKGFLDVSAITVKTSEDFATIDCKNHCGEIQDEKGIIKNAMQALKEVQG